MAAAPPVDRRYGDVSIALHWVIAVLILLQLGLGFWFSEFAARGDPARGVVIGIHKSVGLTVLVLSLIRLGVRLTHPAPPLPADVPGWQRLLARATQVLFYVLIIALPLTGWLMVSTGARPLVWFGLFDWPKIPGLLGDRGLHETLESTHVWLAWTAIATLVLHVAGALKHQFVDRNLVLWRMLPLVGRPPVNPATGASE